MIIKKIGLAVTGVISALLGIICYCMYNGSWESYKEYGGDAYTGIQNAAAQSANNIRYLVSICRFGFGSILLIAGLFLSFMRYH